MLPPGEAGQGAAGHLGQPQPGQQAASRGRGGAVKVSQKIVREK